MLLNKYVSIFIELELPLEDFYNQLFTVAALHYNAATKTIIASVFQSINNI